jgi:hypothetical protein
MKALHGQPARVRLSAGLGCCQRERLRRMRQRMRLSLARSAPKPECDWRLASAPLTAPLRTPTEPVFAASEKKPGQPQRRRAEFAATAVTEFDRGEVNGAMNNSLTLALSGGPKAAKPP